MLKKLIAQIRNWFNPPPARDVPYRVNRLSDALQQESTRRERMTACQAMAESDPRVMAVIRKLSADATKGGFDIVVSDDGAQQIAEDVVKRLRLEGQMYDWLTEAQINGDLFIEVSLKGRDIVALTLKPPSEMVRLSDSQDIFTDPQRAYNQAEFQYGYPTPDNGITFADWQIIHARYGHRANQRYGSPLFAEAIDAHRYLIDGEKNLAIRRRLRSGARLYHHVAGSYADIARYRADNQEALQAGAEAAVIDFFGNSETGPKVIQMDESLGEIADIRHHLQTVFAASPVPIELLGYGENLNRDLLEDKQESYEDALRRTTDWLESQIVKPIIELQWLLYGIYPGALEYDILWARDRQTEAEAAEAANIAVQKRSEAVSEAIKAAQGLISIGASEKAVEAVLSGLIEPLGLDLPQRVITPPVSGQLAAMVSVPKTVTLPTNGSNGRVKNAAYAV